MTSQMREKRKKKQRIHVSHHGTIALPKSIPIKMLGTEIENSGVLIFIYFAMIMPHNFNTYTHHSIQ